VPESAHMDTRRSVLNQRKRDPLRVLLVDDARMILDRLERSLQSIPNIEIVGTSEESIQAKELVDQLKPDLVILDISLYAGNGWDVLSHVVSQKLETEVFMFSNDASDAARERFMLGGAAGFFDKSLDFSALLRAVRKKAANHNSVNP